MKAELEWQPVIADCILCQAEKIPDVAKIVERCLLAGGLKQRLNDLAYQAGRDIFQKNGLSAPGVSD